MKRLAQLIPAVGWLRSYRRADLGGDLTAGLTTAVMLIPQAMAYAMLAGLPPIVGLYASVLPLAVYGLFGSSRQLAVGPVAMVSLLVATGAGALAPTGSPEFIGLALLLALMVGVIQLVMGLVRAGFLTNFLSHPVVSGFTSAAALIIGFSQLKHLLGVNLERSHHVHHIVGQAVERAGEIQGITLLIGALAIAALLALKRYFPRAPRALIVVLLGTLAVYLFGLNEQGVAIVGTVPAGLPDVTVPALSWDAVQSLLPIAITISLVGFMESISVAKAVARRHGYEVDANRELLGLGLANLGAAFTGGYPVTGGFSRTAVNDQAGARTGLASIITATVIALALLFFTPLFYYLPKAVLAAIIMTAVFGLIDIREVRHLWKVKRSDLVLLLATFAATLTFGIEEGILAGVGASLLWLVVRTTRPHAAVLGRIRGTTTFRNIENHPEAQLEPGVLAVRVDAQLYFGNVSFLKEALRRFEAQRPDAATEPLRAVVLDASSINQLDASAVDALEEVAAQYAARGVRLLFASLKQPVLEVMRRSRLAAMLDAGASYLDVASAVEAARQHEAPRPHGPAGSPPPDRGRSPKHPLASLVSREAPAAS